MNRRSALPDELTIRKPHPGRYGLTERIEDLHNAGRDGRKDLPSIDLDGGVSTPSVEFLSHRAASIHQSDRIRQLQETGGLRVALAVVLGQLKSATAAMESARATEVDLAVPLSDGAQVARRAGEHRTEEAIVRYRRTAERNRALAAARADRVQAAEQVRALEQEQCRIEAMLSVRRDIATARAFFIHENALRRVAAYYRRLVRRHKDGERIISVRKADGPELPPWATGVDGLTD